MKTLYKISLLLLVFQPFFLLAQQEMQTGDTTWYKTIIPEAKQGLLKNVSMIANMNFALRNEFFCQIIDANKFGDDFYKK